MCRLHTTSPRQCDQLDSPTSCLLPHDDQEAATILAPFVPKPMVGPLQPCSRPLKNNKPNNNDKEAQKKGEEEVSTGGPEEEGKAAVVGEVWAILHIALPMVLTGLLLYSRSLISMLFLGRLGELPLAGGALAIGFANITGYSVLSGLAMGMEPICGQAHGAGHNRLLGVALQRTVLLLLAASLPIAALWLSMHRLLVLLGQDPAISATAHDYILFSLPDLAIQSFLHPIRVYLRTQSITLPLTYCASAALALHLPTNYLFVTHLRLGIRGVALAGVFTNLNLVLALLCYVRFFSGGVHRRTGGFGLPTKESFRGWAQLLGLAGPSCASVCLEWWWYEIMVLLCGLLAEPRATVASMGVLIQTTALMYIFPSSLGFGVSTRVGNELGANRPGRARAAAGAGVAVGAAMGVASMGFAVSVRRGWAWMFTADAGVAALTAAALPVVGLCELGNCPQTAGCGVLRGSARPRVGASINLGAFYGVGMPVAVALAFFWRGGGMGFQGLWLGMLAAQATCVLLMLAAIRRIDWVVEAERAQKLVASGERRGFGGGEQDGREGEGAVTVSVAVDATGEEEEEEVENSAAVIINIKIEEA